MIVYHIRQSLPFKETLSCNILKHLMIFPTSLGPLLHQRKDTGAWEVLGIVSFGVGCAKLEHPGYYARVNQVVPWIRNILSNGTTCQTDREISESSEDYQDLRSTEFTYSNHSTSFISLSSILKSSNIITALSSFGFALVHVKFIT